MCEFADDEQRTILRQLEYREQIEAIVLIYNECKLKDFEYVYDLTFEITVLLLQLNPHFYYLRMPWVSP